LIYPDSLEHKIGFDGVREHVSRLCTSEPGRDRCAAMTFSTDFNNVRLMLGQTSEMLRLTSSDSGFVLGPIHDRRAVLVNLRVPGTWASENELPGLRASLATMADIAAYFSKQRAEDGHTPYPALDTIAQELTAFPAVAAAIDKVIDRNGQVKDNASPELAQIRRSMSAAAASISSAMRRVISAAVREGYVDADTTPAIRDGRLVIPVAPMYKRKIQGIVHDESASGKTFFIEPAEVVEANNRMRELAMEERHEIVRILKGVADIIRPEIGELLEGFDLLGLFDFINAKAQYAKLIDAQMPSFTSKLEFEWYHACHPGLKLSLERQGKKVVPLDITLTPQKRLLLISGPNAGGKSVTLKTVAIVQYMAQCGLLPPVYYNSHMGMVDSIFIDIGDDQSIEDDLSTYSSHLRNMKFFLNHGGERTLILIDEFGSGTEPQIGGAIAQALLRQFNEKKMWGVITTHYHNLKEFAEATPGLVNGSMLYDRGRMLPLFKLAIGQAGSSFAIEIARKTGLPDEIIADAREIVGSDYINLDRYLLNIARDRRYWEEKRAEIRRKEKVLDDTISRYSEDVENLKQQRRQIIFEAKEEAKRILDGSNASIERTIRDIRTAQAEKTATREARRRLEEERRLLASEQSFGEHSLLDRPLPKKFKAKNKPVKVQQERPLAVGDNVVFADGGDTVGTIESIEGKNAVVVFGQMRTNIKLDRLKRTIRQASAKTSAASSYISSQTSNASRERQLAFSHEIDVRGMRADEAVQAVMYYIDDAIQFNSSRVRILHGTGTGALRQYIRRYLDTVSAVAVYHDEDVRFGGPGITVVEFN